MMMMQSVAGMACEISIAKRTKQLALRTLACQCSLTAGPSARRASKAMSTDCNRVIFQLIKCNTADMQASLMLRRKVQHLIEVTVV